MLMKIVQIIDKENICHPFASQNIIYASFVKSLKQYSFLELLKIEV